jgi:hypothetical protein
LLSLSIRVVRLIQPGARLPLVLIARQRVALGLLHALAIPDPVVLAALEPAVI